MNIEKLWPDQPMVSSSSCLQNLTSLNVGMCNNLKYLFSSFLAQEFVNLKKLRVEECQAMEDIIRVVDQPGEEATTHHNQMKRIELFPKLEYLEIVKLSSLQRFCNGTDSSLRMAFPLLSELTISNCPEVNRLLLSTRPFFGEKVAFPNLKELTVRDCNKIKSLLSSDMARSLVRLKKLKVYRCENMEEVIASDEEYSSSGESIISIIPFQKLQSLELLGLPNLIRFCVEDYCIECPLLSNLTIWKCSKLKEFMGDKRTSSSCTINTTDNNIIGEEMDRMVSTPNKQSLFKHNNKVIFPMLKDLDTDWSEGIKEIFDMSRNSDSIILFPNLSYLELTCTSPDEPIGVSNLKLFLDKYHTIRTLSLGGSFVNLSSGEDELTNNTTTHRTSTCSSLEYLHIEDADMVDGVFGVEPSSSHNNTIILLFPNLKRVNVWGCRKLQRFAPSFMSFPNLVSLEVSGCHRLRYLLSSSTAATLLQMTEMRIRDCDEMKEIIINDNCNEEEEEGKDKSTHDHHSLIVFQNLKELELQNLPSLQSFYSGNKVMSFPNLNTLYINRCPEMRTFSDGISASLLKTIKVDFKAIPLKRDVNATLAELFKEHNNNDSDSNLGLPQLFAHQTDDDGGDGDDDDEHCRGYRNT